MAQSCIGSETISYPGLKLGWNAREVSCKTAYVTVSASLINFVSATARWNPAHNSLKASASGNADFAVSRRESNSICSNFSWFWYDLHNGMSYVV